MRPNTAYSGASHAAGKLSCHGQPSRVRPGPLGQAALSPWESDGGEEVGASRREGGRQQALQRLTNWGAMEQRCGKPCFPPARSRSPSPPCCAPPALPACVRFAIQAHHQVTFLANKHNYGRAGSLVCPSASENAWHCDFSCEQLDNTMRTGQRPTGPRTSSK